jgi:hypothetical protein
MRWGLLVFVTLSSAIAQEANNKVDRLTPAIGDSSRTVTASDSVTYPSPRTAMWRSALIPGGGQFYNGKWIKGTLVAVAELGCVANAIYQNQRVVNSASDYERAVYRDRRNLSYWWLAGIILYSMADAYVDAHLLQFDSSKDLTLDVHMDSYRFSAGLTINLNHPQQFGGHCD